MLKIVDKCPMDAVCNPECPAGDNLTRFTMETNDCSEKKRDISLSISAFSRKSQEFGMRFCAFDDTRPQDEQLTSRLPAQSGGRLA